MTLGLAALLLSQLAFRGLVYPNACGVDVHSGIEKQIQGALSECIVFNQDLIASIGAKRFTVLDICFIEAQASSSVVCSPFAPRQFEPEHGRKAYAIVEKRNQQQFLSHVQVDDYGAMIATPKLFKNQFGYFIEMGKVIDGTGSFNDSTYLFWREKEQKWQLLLVELMPKLPNDLAIRKGIWPDLQSMTAQSSLWNASDGNVGGSGGSVEIKYACDGKRLYVASSKITRAAN